MTLDDELSNTSRMHVRVVSNSNKQKQEVVDDPNYNDYPASRSKSGFVKRGSSKGAAQ